MTAILVRTIIFVCDMPGCDRASDDFTPQVDRCKYGEARSEIGWCRVQARRDGWSFQPRRERGIGVDPHYFARCPTHTKEQIDG